MPGIISYAGNHEDVVLARALGLEPGGFYVDVGAAHPRQGSVTKAFYDAEWSGINVEPMPDFVALLNKHRERDINLNCALGTQTGSLTLFYGRSAYGATANRDHAVEQVDSGHPLQEVTVPVRTLADVWSEYGEGRVVDFLKIDVEGAEREVIAGADLDAMAPRIIVVEATEPYSTTPTHSQWESLLINAGYVFALFDGLNRFYVKRGDEALAERLHAPANALDDYTPFEVDKARRLNDWVTKLEARVRELREDLDRAKRERDEARRERDEQSELAHATETLVRKERARADRAEERIAALMNTRTWRWTAPARRAARVISPRKP